MSEAITIPLNILERRFLLELGRRGGRMLMSFGVLTEDVKLRLDSMVKKEVIRIEPSMVIGDKSVELTDIGKNIFVMVMKEVGEIIL